MTSNYGGMSGHNVAQNSYQLPIKGKISGQKRLAMQKAQKLNNVNQSSLSSQSSGQGNPTK